VPSPKLAPLWCRHEPALEDGPRRLPQDVHRRRRIRLLAVGLEDDVFDVALGECALPGGQVDEKWYRLGLRRRPGVEADHRAEHPEQHKREDRDPTAVTRGEERLVSLRAQDLVRAAHEFAPVAETKISACIAPR
jgi:hypothetical protein